MQIISKEGLGSSFIFTMKATVSHEDKVHNLSKIPIAEAVEGKHSFPSSIRGISGRCAIRCTGRPLELLCVDDSKLIREAVQYSLEDSDVHITEACDGLQAVDLLKARRFDYVLMDINMPVLGGIDATKIIRAIEEEHGRAHTPIIASTASSPTDGFLQLCMKAGVDEVLQVAACDERFVYNV